MAVVVIAPLVAIGVGLCAYLFSGKAVRPIERTMVLLRRFVADAGHELKTPVATMEACLETLEADKETSGISTSMLEMMHRASSRLRHLSKDLIVLAMIEDPESELIRQRIDLKEVAYMVAEELSTAANAKNINISVGPFPEIYVEAHEESLHEIFNNLIDNAIKYSRENGEFTVAATTKGDHVAISFSDCGIGIPPNCIEQVFDRFYRVDDSRTSKIGGSGLGLSIVKAAVERHKGAVTIDSEIDKGTTFTVTLPILRQSQPRTT
jgi:two-component system phosphate regulon sensor histidine kinase PhoR